MQTTMDSKSENKYDFHQNDCLINNVDTHNSIKDTIKGGACGVSHKCDVKFAVITKRVVENSLTPPLVSWQEQFAVKRL